jgi:HSP20 family protein
MISVIFKSKTSRSANYLPEEPQYLTPNMVNWRMSLRTTGVWSPPSDVYETEDKFLVRIEIAGMEEKNFTVRLEQNHLVISGIRQDTPETRAFHRMEIHFGDFSTEIEIPSPIDVEKVTAEYQQGFLRVTLPKAQPRQLIIGA